jgi:hypothetical protein
LDGQPVRDAAGTDLSDGGTGVLLEQRCYQLVRQAGPIVERRLDIEFLDRGAEIYCFTFG